jgi:hypothetical protein
MNRRSIQSFQRHISRPRSAHPLRVATAYRSPVLIRLRNARCGRHGSASRPLSTRRRLRSSGFAARTANTPAFGLGCSTQLATSPAA